MKISIKWVLFLAFTLVISISISFIITSSYLTSKSALLKHSKGVMETIITFTIDKSKNHILVAKDATELTQGLTSSSVVNSEDFKGMEQYFFEQLKINKQFSNIYYGNQKGDFVMASRVQKDANIFNIKQIIISKNKKLVTLKSVDTTFKTIDIKTLPKDTYDPRVRPWFKASIKDKKTIWTDPYVFFESKNIGITAASPVLNKQNEAIGAVGVDIELKELSTFLAKLDFSKTGKVFIFDKNMNLIASDESCIPKTIDTKLCKINQIKNPVIKKSLNSLLEKTSLEQIDKKQFLSFEHNDEEFHAIFSPFEINDIKWIIGIYVAENSYLGDIKKNQLLNTYIAIVIGMIFLYLSYCIANSISKPILQMQNVAHKLKEHDFNVPKIPLSLFSEISESAEAFNEMKDELIQYEKETSDLNKNLQSAYLDTLYRLALAAEHKDAATSEHIHRIGRYSEIIAQEMNMSKKDTYIIRHASLMHDVGKLGISDNILLKPGKLTPKEMKIMKTHSILGGKILDKSNSEIMQAACKIAIYHHEKYDGSGYPHQLKADEIPLMARIVAVADVFDALVNERCYKEAFSVEVATKIIQEGKGSHFDPACVDAFEKSFPKILKIFNNYKENI